jgi:hypothetical protein
MKPIEEQMTVAPKEDKIDLLALFKYLSNEWHIILAFSVIPLCKSVFSHHRLPSRPGPFCHRLTWAGKGWGAPLECILRHHFSNSRPVRMTTK